MKKSFILFVMLVSSTIVLSQDNDTLSVINYNTFEEKIKVYPKVTDDGGEKDQLIAIFGGVSVNLLDNQEYSINRDSLLDGLSDGLTVIHLGSVFFEKSDCEKIEIINNDGVVVRTITGMLGIMPEEIKPFLKMASKVKISGFNQFVNLNGTSVPLELSFNLE